MGVVRYDAIEFTNGRRLSYPVFDSLLTLSGRSMWIPECQNVLLAISAGRRDGGDNVTMALGLPVGASNAWYDKDDHAWYVTEPDSGGYSHPCIAGYLFSNVGLGGYINNDYLFAINTSVLYAYGIVGENRVNIAQVNNNALVLGRDGYSNGYDASSEYTWDKVLSNQYPNRFFVDAYRFYSAPRDFGWLRMYNAYTNAQSIPAWFTYVNYADLPNSADINVRPPEYDDDPNRQGGNSGTGGGRGNFDRSSDTIAVPSLPTLNATDAGFVTLYKPSLQNMIDLAKRLWSPNIIDLVSQLFGDPMDLVIGLGIVPVDAPANGRSSPSIGPIVIPLVIPVYDSQYYQHDCGSIEVREFWGSAFDYSPYTKISIYLPYVGVRELDTDEVMGHTVGVKYHVDLFGGAIMAFVTVDGSVRYQFAGNCMQQIPVGKADYNQLVQNLINIACVVGAGIASSGASAAASDAAAIASQDATGIARLDYGMSAGAANAFGDAVGAFEGARAGLAAMANWNGDHGNQLSACTMDAVMTSKPRVERTGSLSATTGQLGIQTPYLIISRAEQCLPTNYKRYRGYPSNITARLGDLSGYTEVESIRLNNLAATQPEIVEIYDMLKKGVVI